MMAFLLNQVMAKEFQHSIRVLTYLKRAKGSKKNMKGRYVNIILISMQIIANLSIYLALLLGAT